MTDKAARAKLYGKISAVTAEVNRIPKNGRNTFHNYTYATESDITDGLRELLAAHGLAFLPPSVISWERDTTADNPKQGPRTRVQMEFAIACCDTGELYTAMVWGEGQDSGDKGFYKAYTGAVKYFLMKTFLIATGDDPEHDTRPPARTGGSSYEQPRQPVAPAKPVTKRPINREQLIERFRKAQTDAAALGLNYAQYRPEDMSDADMIRVGTEIKEAIAMETTATPASGKL
jgi:hypothetical protein